MRARPSQVTADTMMCESCRRASRLTLSSELNAVSMSLLDFKVSRVLYCSKSSAKRVQYRTPYTCVTLLRTHADTRRARRTAHGRAARVTVDQMSRPNDSMPVTGNTLTYTYLTQGAVPGSRAATR